MAIKAIYIKERSNEGNIIDVMTTKTITETAVEGTIFLGHGAGELIFLTGKVD